MTYPSILPLQTLQQDNTKLRKRIVANKDLVSKKKAELEKSKKEAMARKAQIESGT